MRQILIVAVAALLSACASTAQPPVKPASEKTVCENVADLLANQWATPAQQVGALEIGRNAGCFGTSQAQNINVTVR